MRSPRLNEPELTSALTPSSGSAGGAWHEATWVLIPGCVWVALCLLLWSDRVVARAVLLPVQPADYYLFQALIVVPLLAFLCRVFVGTAVRWGKVANPGSSALRRDLAQAYSLPLAAHLLAELVAYWAWGSGGLGVVARWSAPVAFLTIWLWASRRLAAAGAGWGRAAVAALGSLGFQALLGSWALR